MAVVTSVANDLYDQNIRHITVLHAKTNFSSKFELLDFDMSLLYLIKFTIEYKGIPQKQFIKTWATEADVALKAKEKGKILQIWKVSEYIYILYYYWLSLFQRQNWDTGSTIQHISQKH